MAKKHEISKRTLWVIVTVLVASNIVFGWIGDNPFSYAQKLNKSIKLSSEVPVLKQGMQSMVEKVDAIATIMLLICEKDNIQIPETIYQKILRNNGYQDVYEKMGRRKIIGSRVLRERARDTVSLAVREAR